MSVAPLASRFLMTMEGDIAAPIPAAPNLLVFNVLAATLEGPRIRGSVRTPSGDWIRVQPNGNWRLDVRLTIETHDAEIVYCQYTGLLRMDPGLRERIERGESIDGSEMYFRSTPYFETASRAYAWMNDIVCVGRMRAFGAGRAQYDVFELL